jgi:hypothetical protein
VADQVRDIADELYALPPEDFVAARDERAAEAKKAGDRDLARHITAFWRPSVAAWAVNRLVREQPQEIDQLLALGGRLRAAQEGLAGDELRELNRRRHEVLQAIARQAAELAESDGRPLAESIQRQVQTTLGAAMADPVAGAAVRSGLLTGDLESTGFGPVEVDDAVALPPDPAVIEQLAATPPPLDGGSGTEAPPRPGRKSSSAAGIRDDVIVQRRREEAERAVQEAEELVAHAAHARDSAQGQMEEIARRRSALADRIRDLTRKLQEARTEDEEVAGEERRARRDLEAAARSLRAAERDAGAARSRLERFGTLT